MKTRIFKSIFPVMAFMFAIAGAFAFSSVPESDNASVAQFLGHYVNTSGVCTETTKMCQDEVNNGACTITGRPQLYKLDSPTSCPNQLWRIVP
jgi:hypothetical protein